MVKDTRNAVYNLKRKGQLKKYLARATYGGENWIVGSYDTYEQATEALINQFPNHECEDWDIVCFVNM